MVSFSTMFVMVGEKRVQIVRFTRETVGKSGKLFDIDIHPDGTERYAVNNRPVESLPALPSTKELRAAATAHKPSAVALLAFGEADTPERRAAWWALKDALKAS